MEPAEHLALVKGKISQPRAGARARAGAERASRRARRRWAAENGTIIAQSMRAIEEEGRGVIVLIRDLRPKSLSEWVARQRRTAATATESAIKDRRQVEIGIGSQILVDLGVKDMELLTTSPQHVYVGLEAFGLRVTGTRKDQSMSMMADDRHATDAPRRRRRATHLARTSSSSRRASTTTSPTCWSRARSPSCTRARRDLYAHRRAGRAGDPAGAGRCGRGARSRDARRSMAPSRSGCVIRGETAHYDIVCQQRQSLAHGCCDAARRARRQRHSDRRHGSAGDCACRRRPQGQGRRRGARLPDR